MKQVFATLACLVALTCSAAPVIVQARGSSHASSEDDEVTSSGRAVAVMASTRIEYVPPLRVWFDRAGTLMVCRHPGKTYTNSSKRCELAGNDDIQAGWVDLPNLQLPGYALSAVQVNESKNGPSLVLYWRAMPAKTAKP